MKQLKKFIIYSLITIFSCELFANSGYISKIEVSNKKKEPMLLRVIEYNNEKSYEKLQIGETIYDNDTLQTDLRTTAQFIYEDLTIDIGKNCIVLVKYAVSRAEKEQQVIDAAFEIQKGKLHVSFNGKKYAQKDIRFYYTNGYASIIGTEFDITSTGQVTVQKGTVALHSTKDNDIKKDRPPKMIKEGFQGNFDGPIVKATNFHNNEIGPNRDGPNRDKTRPAPEKRDKEPKGNDRQPADSGMNKASNPNDKNRGPAPSGPSMNRK